MENLKTEYYFNRKCIFDNDDHSLCGKPVKEGCSYCEQCEIIRKNKYSPGNTRFQKSKAPKN